MKSTPPLNDQPTGLIPVGHVDFKYLIRAPEKDVEGLQGKRWKDILKNNKPEVPANTAWEIVGV